MCSDVVWNFLLLCLVYLKFVDSTFGQTDHQRTSNMPNITTRDFKPHLSQCACNAYIFFEICINNSGVGVTDERICAGS